MTFSQETRSGVIVVGIVVGAILAGVLVGTGVLVTCRSGKAVVEANEICCDEVEVEEVNDVVGAMITLVELAMDAELGTAKRQCTYVYIYVILSMTIE